jgi:hypothetical protein
MQARQHRLCGIAGREPWNQEIDRDGDPERDRIEGRAP